MIKKLTPDKVHIDNLLRVIHAEVVSSCGDGDAMWYTRFYDLDEIKEEMKRLRDEARKKVKDFFIKRSVKPTDAVGSVGCKRPLTLC